METHIIDLQLESQPLEEVLTEEAQITLDLDVLIESDPICEITINDIDYSSIIEDETEEELEDGEDLDNNYEYEHLDSIDIDLDFDLDNIF